MKIRILIFFLLISGVVLAQQAPLQYGSNVTLEQAKKIAAAAEAYAVSKNWTVVIAIVDTGGNLVYLQRQDNTQIGSIEVAQAKAVTANNFKRPTKAFQDAVASGGENLRILTLPGAVAVEGGELLILNGKIIGAIGISGLKSAEDTEVAKAGVAVIK
jgi:glc operon protein GlcG